MAFGFWFWWDRMEKERKMMRERRRERRKHLVTRGVDLGLVLFMAPIAWRDNRQLKDFLFSLLITEIKIDYTPV